MVRVDVRTKGFKELRAKLKKAPNQVRDQIRREINKSVVTIDRNAKRLAPVNKNPPKGTVGGRLRSSLRFSILKGGDAGIVFTDVFYGKFQEFGTSRMNAQPFLGPAEREEAPKLLKRIARIMKVSLD